MVQARIPPTPDGTSLAGKTVIITGGNAGLGLEAGRQFLALGVSRLILACRSIPKGEEAVSTLRADSTVQKVNPGAIIDVFELELDDYRSGLEFANRVKKEVKELDILLNNGGIATIRYEKSASGHERTMQVNCYTHILICLELFPLLQSTAIARDAPTRIIFVGSGTHVTQHTLTKSPITDTETVLGHFDDEAKFAKFGRYGDSKLLVNGYVRRLAAIDPEHVVVNNLCPGLVRTGLDKNMPTPLRWTMQLVRRSFARTVEEGARTLIYASVVAGVESNGKFLQNNEVATGTAFLDEPAGKEFTEKLWRETIADVATVDPSLRSFDSS
ncbi:hypothetical protein B0H66DRAFT_584006 [Apodospora peruviana]|uniref:Uncharacterized protein n=1 Tax=Apodospora peruviana TaxID=516989 RepID=A0AAE0HZ79_9PEZI|nr:hypothetical protein B0H66DRAFT_584006 [Apodospora peruviana]